MCKSRQFTNLIRRIIWKKFGKCTLRGYYEVSNLGQVRSVDRLVSFKKTEKFQKGILLKPVLGTSGYLNVKICIDGLQFSVDLHRIVASIWIDNPDKLEQVNHKDGFKCNNASSNLEWCNRSDNANHAYSLNLVKRGSTHLKAVLTEEDISVIRKRIANGETNKNIGDTYGVHRGTIDCIRRNKSWKHV